MINFNVQLKCFEFIDDVNTFDMEAWNLIYRRKWNNNPYNFKDITIELIEVVIEELCNDV